MNKTTKTIVWVVIAIIVIGGIIWLSVNQNVGEKESIKIGFVGPLTGNAAVFGLVEKNVVDIAVEEINSDRGIKGRQIEVIYEDGQCAGTESATAAQKLINVDQVKIIFSVCSSEALAIAPIAEENKVILFTAYANNPDITDAGDYVFRNSHSDESTAVITAETIKKEHEKVGVIYEQTSYAVALKDAFRVSFEDLGGQVYEEGFLQNAKDVRAQITKVLANQPTAVFVDPDSPATGMAALKQLREAGFTGQIYGNFFGGSDEVVNFSEAQGMIFFAEPTIEENEIKRKLFEKYKERYGEYPSLEYPAVARYDVVYIIKQAIEKVGYNPDKIKEYLYELDNFTGALGSYHFDANGDVVGIMPQAKQIKDNKIILL